MNKFVTMEIKQNYNQRRQTKAKAKKLCQNYVIQYPMRGFKTYFF